MSKENYFGLYRGIVVNDQDPENAMRLQVRIPAVWGENALFAEACLQAVETAIQLPPVGATVWIMFENGDPNHPVWMGKLKP